MSGQDNKAVVHRYYEEVFNQRKTSLIDQLAVEDYVEHDPFPGQGNGRADLTARVQAILGAFAPLQFRLEHMVAEQDQVVARWSQTGTHTGAFLGIPPTGRLFTIIGIDIHKLRDGRMAEHWHVVDLLRAAPAARRHSRTQHNPGIDARGTGPAAMSTRANKALLRRYKVDILNNRDIDALNHVAAPGYLDHAAFPGQAPGLQGLKQRAATLFRALDPQWTIHGTIAEDDMVVLRWSLTGTHREAFLGIPPTGKTVTLRGIDIYRIHDGKIAERWNVVDMLGFCQQTGALLFPNRLSPGTGDRQQPGHDRARSATDSARSNPPAQNSLICTPRCPASRGSRRRTGGSARTGEGIARHESDR